MKQLQVSVTDDDHIQGRAGAPITLVEYGDFQCPHCAMAHVIVKRLQRHFGERLRFVYRHFPLDMHPMAEPAAEAAEFAASEGKFWEMHHALFEHQDELSPEVLIELAEQLELNAESAASAMEEQEFEGKIAADMEGGLQSGVHGTPTFFINGRPHQGAFGFSDMVAALDAA